MRLKWIILFKKITLLSDTAKIRLINELMDFATDTSKCFVPLVILSNHYMGKTRPISKQYNCQIEALILINYIAFSSDAFTYSPYPLLYEKSSGKEVYGDGIALSAVIKIYREWFDNILKNGFSNYSYPLFDKQYEWFGSITKQVVFKHYPLWSDFYSCKELE
jgi:hypothetical protein